MKLEDLISPVLYPEIINLATENVDEADMNELFPDYLLEDPMVVGFPDKDMQDAIYRYAITDLIEFYPDARGLIVIDVGCGRGDLRVPLKEYYDDIKYIGFELNSIHVKSAKKKYNLTISNSNFVESQIKCDWIFFIGSLNEDYGLGSKFEYLDELFRHSLTSDCKGMTFILLNDDEDGLISYPVSSITNWLSSNYPNLAYNINFSAFQGLYKLTVFNKYLE